MKYTAKKRVAVHGHAALKIALAASVLIIAATFFGYNAARNSQNEQWEAQQAQQQQQIQTPGEQPVAAEPERLGAVSYTHLDVYKRQALSCNPFSWWMVVINLWNIGAE